MGKKQSKSSKFEGCLGSGTPEVVLPQKTPSPPLHGECFAINRVPRVSVQDPVKERAGELYPFAAPPVNHEFWACSFVLVPIGVPRGGNLPKDAMVLGCARPFLHTPRRPVCISTWLWSSLLCGMNVRALLHRPERSLLLCASSLNTEGYGWAWLRGHFLLCRTRVWALTPGN